MNKADNHHVATFAPRIYQEPMVGGFYDDGRVFGAVDEVEFDAGRALCISEWTSRHPGLGHTRVALQWLREQGFQTITANGVGLIEDGVGDISTMYWQHMHSIGLVDILLDDNGLDVTPGFEAAAMPPISTDLQSLPRADRFRAIAAVMALAKKNGLRGMGGECGELAVAMKRVLFANKAEIVAGLNSAFEKHNHLIGHFAVRINDEVWGCCQFDERGIAISDEDVESWGMLDPDDLDFKEAAHRLGFEFTPVAAETACMLVFDDDEDVLQNMRGSGLEQKISKLEAAMTELGFGNSTSHSPVNSGQESVAGGGLQEDMPSSMPCVL